MLFQVGHEFLGGPWAVAVGTLAVGNGTVVCSGVKMPLFTHFCVLEVCTLYIEILLIVLPNAYHETSDSSGSMV